MSQLTLQLPERLAAELEQASQQSNIAPGELAVELLSRAMAARRFRALRQQALDQLGDSAPESDDDAIGLAR